MMERGNFQLCLLAMHFCRQQSHHPCRTNISGFAANYCKAGTLPVRFQFNILVLVILAKTSVRTKLSGLETLTCAVYSIWKLQRRLAFFKFHIVTIRQKLLVRCMRNYFTCYRVGRTLYVLQLRFNSWYMHRGPGLKICTLWVAWLVLLPAWKLHSYWQKYFSNPTAKASTQMLVKCVRL